MPEVETLTQLEQLQAKHDEIVTELAGLVDKREDARTAFEKRETSEDAKPSDEDRAAFTVEEEEFAAEFDRREKESLSLARRLKEEQVREERRQVAARASLGHVSVTSEPMTYRKDNQHEHSYFLDLASRYHATFGSRYDDTGGAVARLESHAKEIAVELPKREAARERRAQEQIESAERDFTGSVVGMRARRGFDASPFEQRVNPNRTDGQGGFFVPPIWLIDDYIKFLRAGRVAAGLCNNMDLPSGTDSINIPKLATGTATGIQTADNAAVTSTDFTDTSVSAGVKTIAGQQDVAIQLIEQSPGQIIDQVIMQDLLADYNMQVDRQVLLGTGASGQMLGILPVSNYSSTNTVTWTEAAPAGISFNMAVAAAASKTAYTRYNLQNVNAVIHPRRWFWFASALDALTTGRPLVNKTDTGYNISAVNDDPTPEQGHAGHFPHGVDAYLDGNIPVVATAAGAITAGTSDLGVVAKWDDLWLFEGGLRTRVLPEVLSGTLQIRFQVFNYAAFLVRYGQSISVIQGTGMAAPVSATAGGSITF